MFVIDDQAHGFWDRIRAPKTMARILLAAILLAGLGAAIAFFVLPLLRQPPSEALGSDRYLAGQRQLRLTEATTQLAVLRNDIVAGRPTRALALEYARIRADLELVVAGTGAEAVTDDVWSDMDRLLQQIQEEDPRAAETVAAIERSLARTREAAATSPSGEVALRTVVLSTVLSTSNVPASILVEGAEVFAGVQMGDVSRYRTISADASLATVVPNDPDGDGESGASEGRTTRALSARPVELDLVPGAYYTLLLTEAGDVSNEESGVGAPELLMHLIEDDLGGFPPAGRALVRVVHAAVGVDEVTAAISERESTSAAGSPDERAGGRAPLPVDSVVVAESVAFGEHGGYVAVDFGLRLVEFRASGGGNALHGPLEVDLRPGVAYTLYLHQSSDEGALSVVVSVDALLRGSFSDVQESSGGAP